MNGVASATEIYFPTVLEARSLKGKTVLPPKALGEDPCCLHLPVAPDPPGRWLPRSSLCLCLHMAFFSLPLCISFSLLIITSVIESNAYPNDLFLTNYICKDPISK